MRGARLPFHRAAGWAAPGRFPNSHEIVIGYGYTHFLPNIKIKKKITFSKTELSMKLGIKLPLQGTKSPTLKHTWSGVDNPYNIFNTHCSRSWASLFQRWQQLFTTQILHRALLQAIPDISPTKLSIFTLQRNGSGEELQVTYPS